jgi:mono/diheme cytochrome c family protein
MNIRFVIGLAVAVAAGGVLGSALRAQGQSTATAGQTVTSGVYSSDQAKRGQAIYVDSCAKCHLEDLSGGKDSPPLVGDDFLGGWKGKTVGTLFDEVRMTMPFDSPGKLTPEQYADVIAYIFSANKFPAGDKELAHDMAPLEQIQIVAAKP